MGNEEANVISSARFHRPVQPDVDILAAFAIAAR
jgi:hypothetical protein